MNSKIIKQFLKRKNPEKYNLVEDTQGKKNISAYGEIRNVFEKYFVYSASSLRKTDYSKYMDICNENAIKNVLEFLEMAKKYEIGDPDNKSIILKEVYKTLWPQFNQISFFNPISSDCMTSAQTSLNKCMEKIIEDESIQKIYKEKCKITSRKSSVLIAANNMNTQVYELLEKEFPSLKGYLEAYNTIGNYCPVPQGFNVPRSGHYASHDFWDLTLMKIREWYYSINKSKYERIRIIQEELLHNNKEANTAYCICWLQLFGDGEQGWRNFVETLYMQSYVNEKYEVIPLWENHSWECPKLSDREDMNKILSNLTDRIYQRGERIVYELEKL